MFPFITHSYVDYFPLKVFRRFDCCAKRRYIRSLGISLTGSWNEYYIRSIILLQTFHVLGLEIEYKCATTHVISSFFFFHNYHKEVINDQ